MARTEVGLPPQSRTVVMGEANGREKSPDSSQGEGERDEGGERRRATSMTGSLLGYWSCHRPRDRNADLSLPPETYTGHQGQEGGQGGEGAV